MGYRTHIWMSLVSLLVIRLLHLKKILYLYSRAKDGFEISFVCYNVLLFIYKTFCIFVSISKTVNIFQKYQLHYCN